MEPRASTDYIVIHCSATKPSMDVDAETIRNWHVNERGWRDIGYHKVIKRNGDVEDGRDVRDSGAHAAGYNSKSVGVCMVRSEEHTSELQSQSTISYAVFCLKKKKRSKKTKHEIRKMS